MPAVKSDIGENAEELYLLIKADKNETTSKNTYGIKRLLLAMFILSLLSLVFALVGVLIAVETSPLPDFSMTLPEYMWVFYLLIPLPLTSAILGIVFLIKKCKCKKNIIAGFIMTAVLAIYGSFYPILGRNVKHDFKFVNEIANTLPITLPDSGYISYTLNDGNNVKAEAMIKFDDKDEMLSIIESGEWLAYDNLPVNIVPLNSVLATKNYDYFYLYDSDCNMYNAEIKDSHTGHTFIYLAYHIDKNLLQIITFECE